MHARPRASVAVHAKKTTKQKEVESPPEAEVNPADLLTPYEPFDDEGNPWWEPPESDFWEGGAWDWLGKGAAFVLPALLALGVATGVFAITNYLAPEQRALLEAQRSSETTEKLESGLDLMLGSGDNSSDGGASEQGPPKEIAPF